jgi:hypothetical protein
MKSNVDLYLNADRTKVVTEGDPAAASVLVNAGREIPDAEVTAMGPGILEQAQKLGGAATVDAPAEDNAEQQPETKQEEPAEDKAVSAPAEDKAAGKGSQKSK